MSISKPLTYSLVTARNNVRFFNPKTIVNKNPSISGGNLPTLAQGVNQRNKIVPNDPTLQGNPKQIGFYHPNILDSAIDNPWINQLPSFFKRYVRIFYAQHPFSQKVPRVDKGGCWVAQFERGGIHKNQNMGWTYTTDTQSRRPVKFNNLEAALEYCRVLGLGYEISYPNFRYHTRKNYGDNFKWLGPPKTDEDL